MKQKNAVFPFIVLCCLGALLSLFLVNHHAESAAGLSEGPSLCSFSEGFDCDKVNASQYSIFWGVPVAAYSLFFFLSLGFFVFAANRSFKILEETIWSVSLFSVVVAIFPSLFLFWISISKIGVLCPVCLMIDLVLLILLVVAVRSCWSHGIVLALRRGIDSYLHFGATLFSSTDPVKKALARKGFLLLVGIFLMSFYSHSLLTELVHQPRIAKQKQLADSLVKEWIQRWESLEPDKLPIILSQSGFGDSYRGAMDAPFTVIEFADFMCPHCRRASEQLSKMMPDYRNKASIVYKTYPLDIACNPYMQSAAFSLSCRAANMVRCAGEQGTKRFWEMHDALYALEFITDSALKKLPDQLGLDRVSFEKCIEGPEVKSRVLQDIELGHALGITATPTFFIYQDGKILRVPSINVLDEILDSLSLKK